MTESLDALTVARKTGHERFYHGAEDYGPQPHRILAMGVLHWTLRENVRAQMRVLVKRILNKYGYPPDKREKATQTVLEQAELLSREWAVA